MKIPENLKYSKEHEWIKVDDDIATIGITDFAQSELGDIVFVEIDTVDNTIDVDEVFGTIEAVKTVSDLFMPVTAKILELNKKLENDPELVNTDPYGNGWLVKIKLNDVRQLDNLMDAAAYKEMINA